MQVHEDLATWRARRPTRPRPRCATQSSRGARATRCSPPGNSQLAFVHTLVHETDGVAVERHGGVPHGRVRRRGPGPPRRVPTLDPRAHRRTGPPAAGALRRRGSAIPRRSATATPGSSRPPLDLCCLGIGENGHLAFNDPPVADFEDPRDVKVVGSMPPAGCSRWAKGTSGASRTCPTHAITVTIPALFRACQVLAVVPEARKAVPVHAALTGPIRDVVPGVGLRTAAARRSPPRRRVPGCCCGLRTRCRLEPTGTSAGCA